MISLDSSIIPAILIFLALIFVLNHLLFKPLLMIQAQRESRSAGLIARSRMQLESQQDLFRQYEEKIKSARAEAYRHQEQRRGEALKKRAEALDAARKAGERMTEESRGSIRTEVQAAKEQMASEAREIALGIAATILRRSA
jgi:F-type H+-transporting ATPase subunit b